MPNIYIYLANIRKKLSHFSLSQELINNYIHRHMCHKLYIDILS